MIGTGKRVGKTAVSAHLARLLARDRDVVVVTMGRGGPPEPELVEAPPGIEDLVALCARRAPRGLRPPRDRRRDRRAVTIGCRRAGGGLAGRPFVSNVADGARLAVDRRPDVIVFDGSGTAIPPVAADRRVLVVGPGHDLDAHFNPTAGSSPTS